MTDELTDPLQGMGTPEEQWQSWPELTRWPLLDLSNPPAAVVVVAPHPDDEILGVGGLISLLARAGARVHIIAVTDGESSHPGSPTLSCTDLASLRIAESSEALHKLWVGKATVDRLGLPDGGVRDVEKRWATITAAVMRAVSQLERRGPVWCLAPWSRDGHPDHDAAGQAAVVAASGVARMLAYPVWMWHWSTPGDLRVPWSLARRVVLPPDIYDAKLAAVQCFRTQVEPLSSHPADAAILPPAVLRRLTRPTEIVFDSGLA
jgi:LmbE family N-acetylglucosaminyl deacetylase